jgi:hypothetical protein
MATYQLKEAGFVGLHILAADKIAELETVNEKSCFHSAADEVEGNLQSIVHLLLNATGYASLSQLCKELQDPFETVFHDSLLIS